MTDDEEIIHALALSRIPQIGPVQARMLAEHIGSYARVFRTPPKLLEEIPGIGRVRALNIRNFTDFKSCEETVSETRKAGIQILPFTSENFPGKLKNCDDPPLLLFAKGRMNLNPDRVLAVVGTRKPTEQGRQLVDMYLKEIQNAQPLILSGLAYGIDYQAHRTALNLGLPTVAVLANGLHTIYPGLHAGLAREMMENGGVLTEFPWGTKPDKQNFPRRNRIVAGMCDALLVVETDVKGGSMITAEIALSYNRDIFAIPGRLNDSQSRGCNVLIRDNKARLTLSPDDLMEYMNWKDIPVKKPPFAPSLFEKQSDDERIILKQLKEHGTMQIDRLMVLSGLPPHRFHTAILQLELQNLCKRLSGNQFTSLI